MGAQQGEENKNKRGQKAFSVFMRKKITFREEVRRCMWFFGFHVLLHRSSLCLKKKPGNLVTHFKLLITVSRNNHLILEQQGESRTQR